MAAESLLPATTGKRACGTRRQGNSCFGLVGHDGAVNWAAFSPVGSGSLIATGGADGTVRLWDSSSVQEPYALGVLTDTVSPVNTVKDLVFSPDGQRLLVASDDRFAGVWDVTNRTLMFRLSHDKEVSSAVFSPDGKTIVTTDASAGAHLWDAATGEPRGMIARREDAEMPEAVFAGYSPDGKLVIIKRGYRGLEVWEPPPTHWCTNGPAI